MKKILLILAIMFLCVGIGALFLQPTQPQQIQPIKNEKPLWQFMSIDTMKYSRDLSRQAGTDPSFDQTINAQMDEIAKTGATHVAIGTPYDDEFLPVLRRWVASARTHHLHVWFRGNWSGWEKWFGYGTITPEQHIQMTKAFILAHPDLFENGDVFTACPECENGGPGDPRQTGKVDAFRNFLISEYNTTHDAFQSIHKDVTSNYLSMNYDVATRVMDKQTTQTIGGIITIDHYVPTGEKMVQDINALANDTDGKIVIGEFGAPIPDIHGDMTDVVQAAWLDDTLAKLAQTPAVVGINYWTSVGGSTELWDDKNQAKSAVATLTKYYMTRTSNE